MPSLADCLIPDERILAVARRHWVVPVRESALGAGLVLAGLVLLVIVPPGTGVLGVATTLLVWAAWLMLLGGAGRIAWNVATWRTAEFAVTSRRVWRSAGIVRRRSWEAPVAQVTDVRLEASLVARRLGFGDVRVFTTGGRPAGERLPAIARAAEFRTAMLTARKAAVTPPMPVPLGGAVAPAPAPAPPATATVAGRQPADGAPPSATTRRPPSPRPGSAELAARIERLAELRDRGLITQGEFEAKKAELLARI
jgi:hypothetical protein